MLLGLCLATGLGCESSGATGPSAEPSFYDVIMDRPIPVGAASGDIVDKPLALTPGATADTALLAANTENWQIHATALLDSARQPRQISSMAGRVLVAGAEGWQLFGNGLTALASGSLSGSPLVADAATGLFYLADSDAGVVARKLTDGAEAFAAYLNFGENYPWSFAAVHGNEVTIVREPIALGGEAAPTAQTIIEQLVLSDDGAIDADGVRPAVQQHAVRLAAGGALADMNTGHLVIAVRDHFFRLGPNLQVQRSHTGTFQPLSLSVDSVGNLYAVVETESQKQLWALNANGERWLRTTLDSADSSAWQATRLSQRIFVVAGNRIVAVDLGGRQQWEHTFGHPVVAASAAGNGLLVASGSMVVILDQHGRHRPLYDFGTELLSAASLQTDDGTIVVASDQKLYKLAPGGE